MSYVPSPIHWLIDKYNDWRYPMISVTIDQPVVRSILESSDPTDLYLGDPDDQPFDQPSPFSMGESFEP